MIYLWIVATLIVAGGAIRLFAQEDKVVTAQERRITGALNFILGIVMMITLAGMS